MLRPAPAVWRRALVELRARGEAVEVVELAQRLLALDAPVDPPLARRLVAAALDRPAATLPERIPVAELRPSDEIRVAELPLSRAAFAVVDLETTGLSTERCSILEIGAVRVAGLHCTDRFESFVRPARPVPRRITDLTGIDDAMVASAPPPRLALPAFRRWLARTPAAPFVAHNAGFDARFVERALDAQRLAPYPGPVLCTRRLARRIIPEVGRYNLDHLCAHFGISNRARHRALGDAAATATALIELLHLARARLGVETVGELLDLHERKPARRRRSSR